MAITSSKATSVQLAWLEQYERETRLAADYQDDFDNGDIPWSELVRLNIDHFEDWACRVHVAIQENDPTPADPLSLRGRWRLTAEKAQQWLRTIRLG